MFPRDFYILFSMLSSLGLSIGAAGCGYSALELPNSGRGGAQVDRPQGGGPPPTGFAQVRAQVFQPHCFKCHSDERGNAAGLNTERYADVTARIDAIKFEVSVGSMPPAGMPDSDISLLMEWINQGAPEEPQPLSVQN